LAEGRGPRAPALRILLMEGGSAGMAQLDKWLVRAAFLGLAATVLAGALFWLLLTRPVAMATVLGRVF
jgi:hypothetical protein